MAASSAPAPVLLLIEREMAMVPVNPQAFQVTQASARRLRESYLGARVVSPDGELRTIQDIRVGGLWGDTPGRKIVSALSGARKIEVRFDAPRPIELGELKVLVLDYLPYDRRRGDPYLPVAAEPSVVERRVQEATSFREVFEAIGVPELEDCLDVL